MLNKNKKGEKEAIELLEKIGLSFDHNYSDQFKESMPDLLLLDGNYIEVTHTKHKPNNDCYYMSPSNEKYFKDNRELFKGIEVHPYDKKKLSHLRKMIKESKINELIKIPNDFLETKDIFIISKHREKILNTINNLSDDDKNKYSDELFDFDMLLSRYCAFIFDGGQHEIYNEDTIIKAINIKKSKKEKYGVGDKNVDCFIWVFSYEYRIIENYFKSRNYNSAYNKLINDLSSQEFENIYIGKYDFDKQDYDMNELFHFNRKEYGLRHIVIE